MGQTALITAAPEAGVEPSPASDVAAQDSAANPTTLKHHIGGLLFQEEPPPSPSSSKSSLPEFHIIRFDPEVEAQYKVAQEKRILPLFRFALLAAAFFVMAYVLWDFYIYTPSVVETLPVRMVTAIANLGLWALTFHAAMQKRISLLMYAATIVGVLALSIILLLVPNGFQYGLAGFIFFMLASIAVAPNLRVVLWGSLALIVIPNAIMGVGLALNITAWFIIVNANAFIIPLSALACLLSFLTDQNYRRTFELEVSLQTLAATDTLTGIPNRRSFLERAEAEIARAHRHDHKLCLLLMDIDRFKPVNDTYGHQAGDEVIKIVANVSHNALRESDLFGRMGGEEFAAILPETQCGGAVELAERVRRHLENSPVPIEGDVLNFTVSIGVACLLPEDTISSLLRRADGAMYEAKQGGRNLVMLAQ